MKRLVVATALTLLLQPARGLEGPLAATTQGASCKPSTATAGKLNCYYKLPDGTSFDIEWVGDGPQIQIMRADRRGDYAVSFDTRSLCIMVSYGGRGHATLMKIQGDSTKPASDGLNKLAFVSPRTGRVHEDGEACRKG